MAAIGAVAGAVLIAAAGLWVFGGGSEAGDGYPLAAPDLAEQPELAWTLDRSAEDVMKADNGLLIVSSGSAGEEPAVHGVEPDTGEVRWTRETFDVGFDAEGIWCYVPFGDMVACSAYAWSDEARLALLTLDAMDGSQGWTAEQPSGTDFMRVVGDELLAAIYTYETGDVEVSRLASDGTTRWTSTDNVASADGDALSAVGMTERYVHIAGADRRVGFDSASGQLVPWLTSEPNGDVSVRLVTNGAFRIDRTGGATSVERLDDEGAVVWAYHHQEPSARCNDAVGFQHSHDVNYRHLYLCSDDGRSVTALEWETGQEAWTAAVPDGAEYVGESADSVVFAGDGTLSVIDVASGEQRWQRRTVGLDGDDYYTGADRIPVGDDYVYAVEGVAGTGATPTPAPGSSAVVAYNLDEGAEVWRLPVSDLGNSDQVRLVVEDGQLLLINGGEWIAAIE